MRTLGGNCSTPHASYAEINNDLIKITGLVCSNDGKTQYKETIYGNLDSPEKTGFDLAKTLIEIGALDIEGISK